VIFAKRAGASAAINRAFVGGREFRIALRRAKEMLSEEMSMPVVCVKGSEQVIVKRPEPQ